MAFFSYLPDKATALDIFKSDINYFEPLVNFIQINMRGESELSFAERELIGAFVSGLNACDYCFDTHKATAKELGVEVKIFDQIMEDIDTADVEEKLKPVLRFVKKLTLTPSRMVQADADAVINAGWSEKTLRDAICTASIFSFMNRLVNGYGAEKDPAIFARARKSNPESDYVLRDRVD